MKKVSCLLALCLFSHAAFAQNVLSVRRGGFGFLYPDNNSVTVTSASSSNVPMFTNSARFANSQGTAVQAEYDRTKSGSLNPQDATPSIVYGNGKFGVGAFGDRVSTDLTKRALSVDSAGAGLGISAIRNVLDVGVSYSRELGPDQPNAGILGTSFVLGGSKPTGFAFGAGATTTLSAWDRNIQTGTVGLGYSFQHNVNIEANVTVNDFGHMKDYVASAFINVASNAVYLSTGYNWLNKQNQHQAMGRLGFIVAHYFDFSGLVSYTFYTGSNLVYGGTMRVVF